VKLGARGWVAIIGSVAGVVALAAIMRLAVESAMGGVAESTRMFVQMVVVTAMLTTLAWRLLLVPMQRRRDAHFATPSAIATASDIARRSPRATFGRAAQQAVPARVAVRSAGRHLSLVPRQSD
jgi:hypothetical protein